MFKHCKRLFALAALFAFMVAELIGAEARQVLAGIEHSDSVWEYALESGADEETAEDVTLGSGGSDDAQAGTAPGRWRTPAPIFPGHSVLLCLQYSTAAARAAHINAGLLKRIRPPLFILYCHLGGALPGITV